MKKNDGEKPLENIKDPCNSEKFDMITDDFLPGVCGNYQMYPEISQDLMWYPRVTFFEWFLDEATPVVWLLRVANRDGI